MVDFDFDINSYVQRMKDLKEAPNKAQAALNIASEITTPISLEVLRGGLKKAFGTAIDKGTGDLIKHLKSLAPDNLKDVDLSALKEKVLGTSDTQQSLERVPTVTERLPQGAGEAMPGATGDAPRQLSAEDVDNLTRDPSLRREVPRAPEETPEGTEMQAMGKSALPEEAGEAAAETGEAVAEGAEATEGAVAGVEAASAAAAPETLGLSEIIGGLVGIGSAIAEAVESRRERDEPQPNLSMPVKQVN